MALDYNKIRFYGVLNSNESYLVGSGEHIFQGSAVCVNSAGYLVTARIGAAFVGFARFGCDNRNGPAGAHRVDVQTDGKVILEVPGASVVDNNMTPVYAADDDTFQFDNTLGEPLVGFVSRYNDGDQCVVKFG
ncbi:MAG: cytoplasmic protein [Pseudomonadota bacterium]